MVDTRASQIQKIGNSLFEQKRGHNQLNQRIAELMYPQRADFTQTLEREEFADMIFDSTAIQARNELADNVDSMLRQGEWFEVGTDDPDRDERPVNAKALQNITKRMRLALTSRKVNWKAATKETDNDYVTFGEGVLSWEENRDRTAPVLKAHHPKSCAWMVGDDNQPNCLYRKPDMDAITMANKFKYGRWNGKEPRDLARIVKDKPTQNMRIMHMLRVADDVYGDDVARMRQLRHPFVSIYVDLENEEILHEHGVPFFNFYLPRWRTLSGDPNGWAPAAVNSLGDVQLLQTITRVLLEQGEKSVDPPIILSSEIFTRDLNLFAGGATFVDMADGNNGIDDLRKAMTTVETGRGINDGLLLRQDVRNLIASAWLMNKLVLPSVREMREVEVMQRIDEYRRAALPFFSPIETEYHTPVLGGLLDMMIHMRLIRPQEIPMDLQDREIEFTFNTPLNDAEGRETVESFFTSLSIVAAGAEVDPTVSSVMDVRKATEDALRGAGDEADWILEGRKRAEKDAEADEDKRLARAANIAQGGAAAVQDLANAEAAVNQSQAVRAA